MSWRRLSLAFLAVLAVIVVIAVGAVGTAQTPSAPLTCAEPWPSSPGATIEVSNIDDLERAVRFAGPGETILVADGDYQLRQMLHFTIPDVTLRGKSGSFEKVTLRGQGMIGDRIRVGLSIAASGITISDITVRDLGYHAVQVRGESGASNFTLYRARLMDTGQQLFKGSIADGRLTADDGLIACSDLSFTSSAPSDYTNGIDLLATKGWIIRDNRLARIRGPESAGWRAGPAILVWTGSEDTVVERNLIVDSYRGIALGLLSTPSPLARRPGANYDHLGGAIRNNVIVNLNGWADEAIEANLARDVRIEHNTVMVESRRTPWSIGVRFPNAFAIVRNNLTNQAILERNSGRADSQANMTNATRSWFVDALRGDLHLTNTSNPAVDRGVPIPDIAEDFDRLPRLYGNAPDIGAFEVRPSTPR